MGNLCTSCCKTSSYEDFTPDLETRRKQQVEAAERRMAAMESRGIKNIDAVKRQQRIDQEREKRQEEAGNMDTQNNLRWQVN